MFTIDILSNEDAIKFEKQGWIVSDTGGNLYSVQRIDDVENWKHDNEREYDIPQLKSDKDAWALATNEGFILNGKGEVLGRMRQ